MTGCYTVEVLHPPPLWLTSRTPLWSDPDPISVPSQWRDDWQSAKVVNSSLVDDLIISLLGFQLAHQLTAWLLSANLLPSLQSGFWLCHLTAAVLQLLSDILLTVVISYSYFFGSANSVRYRQPPIPAPAPADSLRH